MSFLVCSNWNEDIFVDDLLNIISTKYSSSWTSRFSEEDWNVMTNFFKPFHMTIEPTSTILIIPLSNLNFLDNETQRFSCYYTERMIEDHIGCHVWKVSRCLHVKDPLCRFQKEHTIGALHPLQTYLIKTSLSIFPYVYSGSWK
jgi:hypothetical protein